MEHFLPGGQQLEGVDGGVFFNLDGPLGGASMVVSVQQVSVHPERHPRQHGTGTIGVAGWAAAVNDVEQLGGVAQYPLAGNG